MGRGEKFTQANVKDFGYGDLRDILAGMDVLEKRFPIDKNREGLTGWSYGGFMTMFGVTQTTRFKAGGGWRGDQRLEELLRRELDRPVDGAIFRGDGV